LHPAETAKAHTGFRDSAKVKAERTIHTALCSGRVRRQTIWSPAAIVNLLDLWPDFLEMAPDTVTTEANYTGNGGTTLAAVSAGAQVKVIVFKESFSAAVHELVVKRIVMLTNQRC